MNKNSASFIIVQSKKFNTMCKFVYADVVCDTLLLKSNVIMHIGKYKNFC